MRYTYWAVGTLALCFLALSIKITSNSLDISARTQPMNQAPQDLQLPTGLAIATFAAGCFRCIEPAFQEQHGVIDAIVGYAGGTTPNPTYELVSQGNTDYREAVQVTYDPMIIDYPSLIQIFRTHIDPVDTGGQFVDRGFQYTTAIFYHDEEQQRIAEESKHTMSQFGKDEIATVIIPYTTFYPAEEFHQDFYKHSAERYQRYKDGSGRPEFFDQL